MRIIGNSHDYYDSARAFGSDPNVIFERGTLASRFSDADVMTKFPKSANQICNINFLMKHNKRPDRELEYRDSLYASYQFNVIRMVVWFAGKGYRGMKLAMKAGDDPTIVWSYEGLVKFFEQNDFTITDGTYLDPYANHRYHTRPTVSAVDYFKPIEPDTDTLQWMLDNRIAIAYQHNAMNNKPDGFHINKSGLGMLNFQTIVDAYTAFQELSMWVGGVLCMPNPKMVTLSDIEKVRKHGFDKLSFRKEKQTT